MELRIRTADWVHLYSVTHDFYLVTGWEWALLQADAYAPCICIILPATTLDATTLSVMPLKFWSTEAPMLRKTYGRVEALEPPLNGPSVQIVYGLVLPSHGSPLTRTRMMCWQHGAKISEQASICGSTGRRRREMLACDAVVCSAAVVSDRGTARQDA
jgi:hypothetical protein